MKNYYRCWLWENGAKSTELTQYMVAPFFYEDNLDDTLDTGEIILDSMPIETKNMFPPKTKLRVERYLKEDYSDEINEDNKWDLMVEVDNVEEYPGCSDICCHRIECIEASVYAQGVHVDNFALTYELQDVKMNYKVVRSVDAVDNISVASAIKMDPIVTRDLYIDTGFLFDPATTWFSTSYAYIWDEDSYNDMEVGLNKLKSVYYSGASQEISFKIPKLYCVASRDDNAWSQKIFQMNTVTRIYKTVLDPETHDKIGERIQVGEDIISGPKSFGGNVTDDVRYVISGNKAYIREVQDIDRVEVGPGVSYFSEIWKSPSQMTHVAYADASFPDTITFNTEAVDVDANIDVDGEKTPLYYGHCYEIEVCAYGSYIPYYYKKKAYNKVTNIIGVLTRNFKVTTVNNDKVSANTIRIYKSFTCEANTAADTTGGPFILKGQKYSCFNIFRKALLTTDTQILDNTKIGLDSKMTTSGEELGIQYPIIITDKVLLEKMKTTIVYETIFEQKNLWEVLVQIGYYLHAIPYLTFAEDGTDRYILNYKQLGKTELTPDETTKLTIYNSKNLSDYFVAFDSYVTNMFSPQNAIDEWLVVKTSDSSFLVNNDTAELKCSYPITEIIEFDITYKGETKSALNAIFEKSIYEVLSNEDPTFISPSKGRAIYYTLGNNKIQGLTYVAPSEDDDNFYALKYIVKYLFRISNYEALSIKFNELMFHIKYRTQDSMRVKQFRPDIDKFIKNTAYEKYPHGEQYFGQQDKIIDSEKFAANLWGKLIRTGNGIYQRQEYAATPEEEKKSGDLVSIGNSPYYVTKAENELYSEGCFQKVTYSKNFNQISQVVTIPSEPRFYEVSERTTVRREVGFVEFLKLGAKEPTNVNPPRFINPSYLQSLVENNLFNYSKAHLPNFAYIRFMADYLREHKDQYGAPLEKTSLFPSSEIVRDAQVANSIYPKEASDHVDILVPAIHYPFRNSLVFEWDMEDNFKAGDFIDSEIHETTENTNADGSYFALQSARYCDIMGRADLMQFKLTNKDAFTLEQMRFMPKCNEVPLDEDSPFLLANEKSIGLDKDCREALSFNLQLNLVYDQDEGFVTYPNIWGEKDIVGKPLTMCLCDKKKSLFDMENADMLSGDNKILLDNIPYNIDIVDSVVRIIIDKTVIPEDFELSNVNSIVLYDEDANASKYAYIVRNVDTVDNTHKLDDWFIYPIFNEN